MALTREQVVETAVRLLDEHGLDALTLRRLATELGVSAPTLYWHVRDKRELLDLMSEAMITRYRDTLPPMRADMPWEERVAEGARRQYEALLHHRDGARVVAGNRPTRSSLPVIEGYLRIWVDAGFPPEEALAAVLSLGDYITGSALEYQAELERRRTERPEERREVLGDMTDYPTLQSASLVLRGLQPHSSFEHGLKLFIAGIRQRRIELQAQMRKAAPSARPSGPAKRVARPATRRPSAVRPR